ncbi:hypothetical protein LCGC14_2924010 [marine sediment metagenome]|uniref:Uncharacterized protein n=1 Tax=marine sediment metagenome TaxID=412755 RepID=A0A0F8ZVI3_9ZZZZ
MEYDDWQIEIIEDTSQYILLCKGRQIGGTTAFAKKAAKWMAEKGKTILVGSITEEQAKLVIVMVKDILTRDYKGSISTVKKDKPTLDKITLKNGGWIRSRAVGTMGDAFKGFTADVNWFNEMSKWPELAFIAIMPTLLTKGGEMWEIPHLSENIFMERQKRPSSSNVLRIWMIGGRFTIKPVQKSS